ncbi:MULTISPECIES: CoA transferase [unclassified Arthrobacter]|uniref:CoA transferase n=1 Tax=unclassified Arthrobacter TaxID=235627 RepID=UPI002155CD89|nr:MULTISPECIES: CoA transferase [unclassified Arthrobacter]
MEEGRSAFHRIAATCDIVIEAMRRGVAAKLGVVYEKLRQHKPDIITQTLTGYGEGGPLSARRGVNMVNQAESGMICLGRG